MKKTILLLLSLTLYFACSNKEKVSVSNDLKKRVIVLEGLTGYVMDSIIETFENKYLIKSERYFKIYPEEPFIATFNTYEYDQQNYLIKRTDFSDINLSSKYATTTYSYKNNKVQSVIYKRFAPSNFSTNNIHYTKKFDYNLDTINEYLINHLKGDLISDEEKHIVYGNLDSIHSSKQWMFIFDNFNDITEVNCAGNDCDDIYDAKYIYGETKTPLINKMFGNDLNMYLLDFYEYHYLETRQKRMVRVSEIFPTPERNNNSTTFNYVFDDNDRLIEMYTTGTYTKKDYIKYYYE